METYIIDDIANEMGLIKHLESIGVKTTIAKKAANKYVTLHLTEYFTKIGSKHGFSIQSAKLLKQCGQININGKKQRLKTVLDNFKPFFYIATKGNNIQKVLSTGTLSKPYKDIVSKIDEADKQTVIAHEPERADGTLYTTLVDKESLRRAITDGVVGKMENPVKLSSTQRSACKYFEAKALANGGVLITNYVQNKTGRLYATGTNLQNAPKLVRRAVLGSYKLLDYKSACFSVIHQIARLNKFASYNTLELYVNDAEKFRLRIANDITNSYRIRQHKARLKQPLSNTSDVYKNVKTAFTAIGFGARVNGSVNSCWYENGVPKESAIKAALTGMADDFINHPKVKAFIADYKSAMEWVYSMFFSAGDAPIYNGVTIDRTESPSKQYATIYQSLERQLLDILVANVPSDDLLLLLHDGVAVRKSAKCVDIKAAVIKSIISNFTIVESNNSDKLIGITSDRTCIDLSIETVI